MVELVPYHASEPAPFDAEWLLDPAEIATRIGGTDFVPTGLRDNPAAITAALLFGAEVGLGRMASLGSIAVINGRPTMSAEAQRALILRAGHEIGFEEMTATRCIAWARRRGSQQVTRVTWTLDDAKRAGLAGRGPWRAYPRQMLIARASAELARAVFPDVLYGLAAREELEDDPALGAEPGPPPDEPTTTRRRRRAPEPAPELPAAKPDPVRDTGGAVPPSSGAAGGEAPTEEALQSPSASSPPLAPSEAMDEIERLRPAEHEEAAELEEVQAASDAQRRKAFALMGEVGIGSDEHRELRLTYTSRIVGRTIETSSDLTADECSVLIDDLLRIAELPVAEQWRELLPEHELELVREGDEVGAWHDPEPS